MRAEWTPAALESAAGFITDQPAMRAINMAVATLARDPVPPEAFVRGDYRRLRAGAYRVMYVVDDDVVTVVRVDRLT